MKPSISEADFAVLVNQTGLPLSAEQRADIYAVYGLIERQVARVHTPLPRAAEPAFIFKPEAR